MKNGKIAAEGEYLNGKQTGKWINYDKQGNKTSIVKYKQGRKISQKVIKKDKEDKSKSF